MTARADRLLAGRELIFESHVDGDVARVAAVDVATGVEAHAIGPKHVGATALERIAAGKLARALVRAGVLTDDGDGDEGGETKPTAPSGRGRLV